MYFCGKIHMSKLTIIGDVHGKISAYGGIVSKIPFRDMSICVGDFGFKYEWDWYLQKKIDGDIRPNNHINPGNHDYGPYLNDKTKSLGNWHYFEDENIFTVRGAWSIDKIHRTEGFDWFDNEELTYAEGLEALDEYVKVKPRIIVSHDCPQHVRNSLFGIVEKSITTNLLQAMFDVHQPELWVFGHHHKHRDANIFGTRFICLEELKTLEIVL
jgi:hypothetical protein